MAGNREGQQEGAQRNVMPTLEEVLGKLGQTLNLRRVDSLKAEYTGAQAESEHAPPPEDSRCPSTDKEGTEGIFPDSCLLGSGRYGRVYLCRSKANPSELRAVKVLQKEDLRTDTALNHLVTEIVVLMGNRHESMLPLYNVLHCAKSVYLVMERGKGRNLMDLVKARTRLEVLVVRRIMKQLLAVLNFLHQRGIVHRDVKADNLICNPNDDWDTKLVDFGIAKLIPRPPVRQPGNFEAAGGVDSSAAVQNPPSPPPSSNSPGLINVTPGTYTPQYAALEALLGETTTTKKDLPKRDIYGAGATMWVCLVGRFPPWYRPDLPKEVEQRDVTWVTWEGLKFSEKIRHKPDTLEEQPNLDSALALIREMCHPEADKRPSAQAAQMHDFFHPGMKDVGRGPTIGAVGNPPSKKGSGRKLDRGRHSKGIPTHPPPRAAEAAPAEVWFCRRTSTGEVVGPFDWEGVVRVGMQERTEVSSHAMPGVWWDFGVVMESRRTGKPLPPLTDAGRGRPQGGGGIQMQDRGAQSQPQQQRHQQQQQHLMDTQHTRGLLITSLQGQGLAAPQAAQLADQLLCVIPLDQLPLLLADPQRLRAVLGQLAWQQQQRAAVAAAAGAVGACAGSAAAARREVQQQKQQQPQQVQQRPHEGLQQQLFLQQQFIQQQQQRHHRLQQRIQQQSQVQQQPPQQPRYPPQARAPGRSLQEPAERHKHEAERPTEPPQMHPHESAGAAPAKPPPAEVTGGGGNPL
eukprot:Hpha_TRINITY_DN23307_c0_g1::TRINITY_DN23307_c0_g1_i1::g.96866::m.96866